LDPVLAIQLPHNRAHQVLDALLLKLEYGRDPAVGHSLRYQLRNLKFSLREVPRRAVNVHRLVHGRHWLGRWLTVRTVHHRSNEPSNDLDKGGRAFAAPYNGVRNSLADRRGRARDEEHDIHVARRLNLVQLDPVIGIQHVCHRN
jgi:hypothetical protein